MFRSVLGVGVALCLVGWPSGGQVHPRHPETVDVALEHCLGRGTPDALERRVPGCRAAVQAAEVSQHQRAAALVDCLGHGTPDALERRVPGCRESITATAP